MESSQKENILFKLVNENKTPATILGYFLTFLTIPEQTSLCASLVGIKGNSPIEYIKKVREVHSNISSFTLNVYYFLDHPELSLKEKLSFLRRAKEVNIKIKKSYPEREEIEKIYQMLQELALFMKDIKSLSFDKILYYISFDLEDNTNIRQEFNKHSISSFLSFSKLQKLELNYIIGSEGYIISSLPLTHLYVEENISIWDWDILPQKTLQIMDFQIRFDIASTLNELKRFLDPLFLFSEVEYIRDLRFLEKLYSYECSGPKTVEFIELLFSKFPKLKYLRESSRQDIALWCYMDKLGNKKSSFNLNIEHLDLCLDLSKSFDLEIVGEKMKDLRNPFIYFPI